MGIERRLSPHCAFFPYKHCIMADCPSPFHRACQWIGAPMCGQLHVGRRLVGVLGDGGCPLNLLITLWQSTSGRYHMLCWPPAQRILSVALQRWAFLTDTQETQPRWRASYGLWGEQVQYAWVQFITSVNRWLCRNVLWAHTYKEASNLKNTHLLDKSCNDSYKEVWRVYTLSSSHGRLYTAFPPIFCHETLTWRWCLKKDK